MRPTTPLASAPGETERLVRAAVVRDVRSVVIRPSLVWGDGYHSIAEKRLDSYRTTASVCYVGEGTNCHSSVNVEDLADLYLAAPLHGKSGALYHAMSGEVNNRCIAELLARRFGCGTRSVDLTEAIAIWGKFAALVVLSTSSRTRCPRARGPSWAGAHGGTTSSANYCTARCGRVNTLVPSSRIQSRAVGRVPSMPFQLTRSI